MAGRSNAVPENLTNEKPEEQIDTSHGQKNIQTQNAIEATEEVITDNDNKKPLQELVDATDSINRTAKLYQSPVVSSELHAFNKSYFDTLRTDLFEAKNKKLSTAVNSTAIRLIIKKFTAGENLVGSLKNYHDCYNAYSKEPTKKKYDQIMKSLNQLEKRVNSIDFNKHETFCTNVGEMISSFNSKAVLIPTTLKDALQKLLSGNSGTQYKGWQDANPDVGKAIAERNDFFKKNNISLKMIILKAEDSSGSQKDVIAFQVIDKSSAPIERKNKPALAAKAWLMGSIAMQKYFMEESAGKHWAQQKT